MNQPQLYDLSFLRKFTKEDPEKIARYIKTYLRTSERIFNELIEATESKDWESVYVKAHSLKPQVQYMGIISLQEVLIEIEDLAKSKGEPQKLKSLVEDASKLFKSSYSQLQNYQR